MENHHLQLRTVNQQFLWAMFNSYLKLPEGKGGFEAKLMESGKIEDFEALPTSTATRGNKSPQSFVPRCAKQPTHFNFFETSKSWCSSIRDLAFFCCAFRLSEAVEPNIITHSSLISALAMGHEWQKALHHLTTMRSTSVVPNRLSADL